MFTETRRRISELERLCIVGRSGSRSSEGGPSAVFIATSVGIAFFLSVLCEKTEDPFRGWGSGLLKTLELSNEVDSFHFFQGLERSPVEVVVFMEWGKIKIRRGTLSSRSHVDS